jgi:serine/threonine protein kinase
MTEKTLSLKFNVPIFKMNLLSANWEQVKIKSDNFKIYDGMYEGLGPCSILILYNIEKNIDAFYKISTQINIFSNLNHHQIAKLFGIIVDKEKFCLIFERLAYSVDTKLKSKSFNDKEKLHMLYEVMEILLFLHENKLRALDLRPSNILMTETGDVRIIYPMGKNLF